MAAPSTEPREPAPPTADGLLERRQQLVDRGVVALAAGRLLRRALLVVRRARLRERLRAALARAMVARAVVTGGRLAGIGRGRRRPPRSSPRASRLAAFACSAAATLAAASATRAFAASAAAFASAVRAATRSRLSLLRRELQRVLVPQRPSESQQSRGGTRSPTAHSTFTAGCVRSPGRSNFGSTTLSLIWNALLEAGTNSKMYSGVETLV